MRIAILDYVPVVSLKDLLNFISVALEFSLVLILRNRKRLLLFECSTVALLMDFRYSSVDSCLTLLSPKSIEK
ncbi:hypothetical protein Scep_019589 [Stephania cephalantha]|uniref:Uncharacterized protein n=1 Tax=Stephania cephalantha TaxID=152367 RepID=A0AAP0IB66_9MAGN